MTFMFELAYFTTSKVTVTFMVGSTKFITPNGHGTLAVAVTYLINPKVTMTFKVGLN